MLPLNVEDREIRKLRQVMRKTLDAVLTYIDDSNDLKSWIANLREMNREPCYDKNIDSVMDMLDELAERLTTYSKMNIQVRATSQVEGIFGELENWIDRKHGFKSFESAKLLINAYLAHRLFQRFTDSKQYEGMRPVDNCFSPYPRGTWADFCFSKPIWDI